MPLLCFASPKGGVGKTTLAANVADALRRGGRRVVALDLDPQNALRLHFGLPPADAPGFAAALPQRPEWRAALLETEAGVGLLPFGTVELRDALELWVALDAEPELLAEPVHAMLAADPGLVVVADLPPGPSASLAALAPMADLVVAVMLADGASAALLPELDSGRFLGQGTLGAVLGGARLGVVLNQVEPRARLAVAVVEAAARLLGGRLLGALPRDEAVAEALACQRLLLDAAPASRAAADLRRLAREISARLPQQAPTPAPMPVAAAAMPLGAGPAFAFAASAWGPAR